MGSLSTPTFLSRNSHNYKFIQIKLNDIIVMKNTCNRSDHTYPITSIDNELTRFVE